LLSLTSPGDVVLTEALTFLGIKAAAAKLNVRLVGVAMDDEGIDPDALKKACKEHRPKAVYLVLTLHIQQRSRSLRNAVDDAYGLLEPSANSATSIFSERSLVESFGSAF
jgi:dTDP-4-amino-4,6-dideoxygalactose transaminase